MSFNSRHSQEDKRPATLALLSCFCHVLHIFSHLGRPDVQSWDRIILFWGLLLPGWYIIYINSLLDCNSDNLKVGITHDTPNNTEPLPLSGWVGKCPFSTFCESINRTSDFIGFHDKNQKKARGCFRGMEELKFHIHQAKDDGKSHHIPLLWHLVLNHIFLKSLPETAGCTRMF